MGAEAVKITLGPVPCQGCGTEVHYAAGEPADDLLPGWYEFHIDWGYLTAGFVRHRCPAGRRPNVPARILRPWSADGIPIVFEDRLRLGRAPVFEASGKAERTA
jgi:hypothetical protein